MDAVGAVGFHYGNVHGLLDVFIGAQDQAGFTRNVGDYLVVAPRGAGSFQFVQAIGFGRGIFRGGFLLERGLREEDRAGFGGEDGTLVVAGVSGFAFPDETCDQRVVQFRLFEFPFLAGL